MILACSSPILEVGDGPRSAIGGITGSGGIDAYSAPLLTDSSFPSDCCVPTSGTIVEFPVPTENAGFGIAAGPDGNIWFTESSSGQIGRMTLAGILTEFSIPPPAEYPPGLPFNANPAGIVTGPDGNLWFTDFAAYYIRTISPVGIISDPQKSTCTSTTDFLAVGPDANLWLTEFNGPLARVTPKGTLAEFALPNAGGSTGGITTGPDRNIWFTEEGPNKLGRLTPTGTITEFPLQGSGLYVLTGIAAGPDGNIWCVGIPENADSGTACVVGRSTPDGHLTVFPAPPDFAEPKSITPGPDGNLWFTDFVGSAIGRVTPDGIFTRFPLPSSGSNPFAIVAGPDGNIWFTENYKIGRITP
ncbi:MAG: Virginiamycin B lyase [Polyangia bacterium]|jgi:streptogramin lyase